MKRNILVCLIFILINMCFSSNYLPLVKRYFQKEDIGYDYQRGTYLIVLADATLESVLKDESSGDFIYFKKTQGYNVLVKTFSEVGGTEKLLVDYLDYYVNNIDSMLEYVLLVGDINGSYAIPSFTIPSYNESELDVTDYPYTFFNNENILTPEFIIGRWPIRSLDDLKKIKMRSIQYIKMENISDHTFLNNALVVAGNYSDTPPSPVTPVWTSKWLMDELVNYGYAKIDTAFYHLVNQQVNNSTISSSWDNGVGIINYRGWGDANGWHFPYFHRENIDPGLHNGWYLPIVMSFVCNTGDFGNDFGGTGLDKCFGETLITAGSINNPRGAAAMIGPSDLDTDTRFNNVMCAVMWDELLEGRVPELGPALHSGKQALIKEFGDLEVNGTNIVEFYHHVYGVLGDPSLSVWLGEPDHLVLEIDDNAILTSSFISTIVKDTEGNPIMDVVGALIYDGELIAKGLTNASGELFIDFENIPENSNLKLYFNKAQFYQKEISLIFQSDDEVVVNAPNYQLPIIQNDYSYTVKDVEYNWNEINEKGDNLGLVDDSIIKNVNLGFNFRYFGQYFNSLTVCSNGWASFLPCLKSNNNLECNSLSYFYNNSIPHPLGPYGMIAPFFDDLDDNNGSEPFNVYFWTNSIDSAIVEWDNIANGQTDENCPDCKKETFQMILTNSNIIMPADGEIIFQYKEIHDIDDHGSTIGIESPDKNSGVEYLFNYDYLENVSVIENQTSIQFTSGCNENISVNECGLCGDYGKNSWYVDNDNDGLGDSDSEIQYSCSSIENYVPNNYDIDDDCPCFDNNNSCYDLCGQCNGDNSSCIIGCMDENAENYNPEAIVDDGSCELSLAGKLLPQNYTLNTYPNPFNPVLNIYFTIPEFSRVEINIVNILGEQVEQLLGGDYYKAGYYSINWNANAYASGVYFASLVSNHKKITKKIILLK